MKNFELIDTENNKTYNGQFDENSKKYPYVVFNHNGMIGTLNPSKMDSEELNKILISNADKDNVEIKYNEFIIKIK